MCIEIGRAIFAVDDDKKKAVKGREGTKSQNHYISHIYREAPSEPILARFCLSRDVTDTITCAHFGVYKLRG